MPSREEEYAAGEKEPRGRALCPFCGSPKVYYNKRFKSWRCGRCEKSFPSPSYWAGRGLGEKTAKSIHKHEKHNSTGLSLGKVEKSLGSFWRNLKKVLILVFVIATAAIVISAVCLFISGEIKLISTIIIAVVGLIILAWGLRSLSKFKPNFARTFMFLLVSGLFIIASSVYLGIKSPSDIKDSVINALSTDKEQFRSTVDLIIQRTELKIVEAGSAVGEKAKEEVSELKNTENVHINGGILIGADAHYITLRNSPNAKNPSWGELKDFLLKDNTDSKPYDINTFVCADFAEMLHNNAEVAGIRAAFVSIYLGPCSYWPVSGGHALNAFETTDKGIIYIDCTGGNKGVNADKVVELVIGKDYIPESIFPEPGWSPIWDDMGEVQEIEVVQW